METAEKTIATGACQWVKPIDAEGLSRFAEKGRHNPGSKGLIDRKSVV